MARAAGRTKSGTCLNSPFLLVLNSNLRVVPPWDSNQHLAIGDGLVLGVQHSWWSFSWRAQKVTFAPASAKTRTQPSPIPSVPPVTITTLPS